VAENKNGSWLILELSEAGESASRAELEAALTRMLGENAEWFIPIHHEMMGSYVSTSVLIDGYVFIRDKGNVRNALAEIRDHRMFSKVLKNGGKFTTVDRSTVNILKDKLRESIKREFDPGTQVKILDGIFTDLVGEVISSEDDGRKVVVRIQRQTREWVVPLPSTSVRKADLIDLPLSSLDTTGVSLYE
jgi:transcription antitermination factor NusG